jgi:hypothetical protein
MHVSEWPLMLLENHAPLNQRVPGSSPGAHSLRKPHVSGTTPNRAFLRGFSATHFPEFSLYRRSRILVTIFGAPSLHPKIPFPAAGLRAKFERTCGRNSDVWATATRDHGPALQLFRIESKRLKLPTPFSRRIAEPLNADAAGQATFQPSNNRVSVGAFSRTAAVPAALRYPGGFTMRCAPILCRISRLAATTVFATRLGD